MSATRRRRRQTIEKPVTTGQHTSELYERLRARQTRTVVVQHEVEQSDEIDHESHRYQECAHACFLNPTRADDALTYVDSVEVIGAESSVTLRTFSLPRVVPRLQAFHAKHMEAFRQNRILPIDLTGRARQHVL